MSLYRYIWVSVNIYTINKDRRAVQAEISHVRLSPEEATGVIGCAELSAIVGGRACRRARW